MARPKQAKSIQDPKSYRRSVSMNQHDFWTRFGVTQSGGSRYENKRNIATPTAMLMALHETGVINDADLAKAHAAVIASR